MPKNQIFDRKSIRIDPKSLAISIISFANADGGLIAIGITDNGNDISQIMKSINVSYASYFDRINKRCGHLFQDRFKSEMVTDDTYLLQHSKYIHNNPVKAGYY